MSTSGLKNYRVAVTEIITYWVDVRASSKHHAARRAEQFITDNPERDKLDLIVSEREADDVITDPPNWKESRLPQKPRKAKKKGAA